MVESFWAIPDVANLRTPLSILREQASALTDQTKGTLVGMVEAKGEGGKIEISLDISVPSLNDYRYRILTYRQPIELYPGVVVADVLSQVSDEKRFTETVKAVLSSTRVRNALVSLLSQAVEA
jgi:hypothetical protein